MNNEFIELLKTKHFNKDTASVYWKPGTLGDENGSYHIKNYSSSVDVTDKFLKELEEDLEKPIKTKNFRFHIRDMKGFKRSSILSFIKNNKSLKDFENIFHSFYKNFGIDDLFNNLHIKSDYMGRVDAKHPYSPYILFLLKQDFSSNRSFSHKNFLDALGFNFKANENNYIDLKESIYLFIDTHYEKLKENQTQSFSPLQKEEKIRSFELEIYEQVKKHIKKEDLGYYDIFWKSILIEKKSENLFSTPKEQFFIFNIEHSYLTDKYPSLTNSIYAKKACQFVENFVTTNFSECFNINIIKQEDLLSQFVCEFKNSNLNKENLQYFIKEALQLYEDCQLVNNHYLKNDYKEKYEDGINKIKTEFNYFSLQNLTPIKESSKLIARKI